MFEPSTAVGALNGLLRQIEADLDALKACVEDVKEEIYEADRRHLLRSLEEMERSLA